MKRVLNAVAYLFAGLFIIAVAAAILDGDKSKDAPTEGPQSALKQDTSTVPEKPEAQPAKDMLEPRRTFGYDLKEWVIKVKAMGMDRDLPRLIKTSDMKCQVRCAASFTQGGHVAYTVTSDSIDGNITGVMMAMSSDGTTLSAAQSLLVFVTFAQAMAEHAPEKQVSTTVAGMLEDLKSGDTRQVSVGKVKFSASAIEGIGILVNAEPDL